MNRTGALAALALAAVGLLASLAHAQARTYYLRHGSSNQQGCFNNCACWTSIREPLRGTFVLIPSTSDPVFQFYWITSANFYAPTFQQRLVGTGVYQVGGDPAALERMTLDLLFDNTSMPHWDSLYTPLASPEPAIHATLTINQYECYDIVLTIRATPFRSDWDANGRVRLQDVFVFLSDWFAGEADADGDNRTNVGDVMAFVTDWFSGV